jgi:hypothetical protein
MIRNVIYTPIIWLSPNHELETNPYTPITQFVVHICNTHINYWFLEDFHNKCLHLNRLKIAIQIIGNIKQTHTKTDIDFLYNLYIIFMYLYIIYWYGQRRSTYGRYK